MNEKNTVEISKEEFDSLCLLRMRANICKMAMNTKNLKSIENTYFFMGHQYVEEVIEQLRTIEEMAEDTPIICFSLSFSYLRPKNRRNGRSGSRL